LAEGLEDGLVLHGRDANAGIGHGEGEAVACPGDAQSHAPLFGELEGIGE